MGPVKFITLLLLIAAPLAGTMARGLPDGFFAFPPLLHKAAAAAAFSMPWFIGIALLCLATASLLVFPSRFGFRKAPATRDAAARRPWPWWGWAGLAVMLAAWIAAWTRPAWLGFARHYSFFPLWAGFAVILDAAAHARGGRSMIASAPGRYLALYPMSAAAWWYFEFINRMIKNWWYEGADVFGPWTYVLYASLCFSTVLPAVLAARNLLATLPFLTRSYQNGPAVRGNARGRAWGWMATGVIGLFFIGLFPEPLFFMTWLAPLALMAGALSLAGEKTPFDGLKRGDWSPVITAALAALVCGFFWEMWNYWSLPKWHYDVPYVDVLHVFEMPLLGFYGYLPFGPLCVCFATLLGFEGETCRVASD